MKLKCKRCGKEWDYKGESWFWASCPNCRTSVRIPATVPNIPDEIRKIRSDL